MPPAPKGGTPRGAKLLIAAVVVGVVGIVVAGLIANATGPSGADPGECVRVNRVTVTDADVDKVDCGSADAAFKVAANLDSGTDSCPSGDYSEYSERGGRRSDGYKLCLMLNAAPGDCFAQEGTVVAGKTTKVTCDSSATHKVTKVAAGTADNSACEAGEIVFVYSQPATTVCLAEA
ncbi:hypothetical protein [Actinosynnema sp. NPDC020468]|uniref:LppU/SCO3897 family protein n=1 Tax=Actinosynnema sp. NPDC020468 TaxID=3154488 RepID=UPI0033C268BE